MFRVEDLRSVCEYSACETTEGQLREVRSAIDVFVLSMVDGVVKTFVKNVLLLLAAE